jgi:RTX calcium-binding nonapeptide repeat (4 copies)
VEGADGADSIVGGPGDDTILAHGGADLIFASDGFRDIVGCGSATDTAELDSGDGFTSCENRRVGVLRLAPKGLRVEAGKVARLRLSWRHPRSWRRLRRIELRLVHQDAAVGTVTIRPRGQHVSADGVVKLSRRSRFVRKGKTVSARLWLRVDRSLAGRRLRLEVEAVDARGARQLERRAGAIRVAG